MNPNRTLIEHEENRPASAAGFADSEAESTDPQALLPQPGAASPLDLPAEVFRAGLARRRENRAALMEWVRAALVEGVDYGRIHTRRGPSKPSLWKPGAEKICGMLGVRVHFPTLADYEQAALRGAELQQLIVRCELRDAAGSIVADGVGARSLQQDYGDLNKALKMAEKSAHIDATLRMAGLSEVFTQDLEDMRSSGEGHTHTNGTASAPEERSVSAGPQTQPSSGDNGGGTVTPARQRRLEARIQALGLDRERVKRWVRAKWGVERLTELNPARYRELDRRLEHWAKNDESPAQTSAVQNREP